MRLHWADHYIGATCCLSCIGGRVRGSINHDEINPLSLGLLDGCAQPDGMCRYDPRKFLSAPVGPFGRGSLRVHVKNCGLMPLLHRCNGKIERQRDFARSALSAMTAIMTIRVYTYTLLRCDEYTDAPLPRNGFFHGPIVPDTSLGGLKMAFKKYAFEVADNLDFQGTLSV